MASTFDNKFEQSSASTASPFTVTSNTATVPGSVGSNANRVLIAYCQRFSGTDQVTGITWQGAAMTRIVAFLTGGHYLYLYGLIAPATGNGNLVASFSGAAGEMHLGAASFYNADQSTGWQNSITNSGTSTSASVSITSANGNMVFAGMMTNNASSDTVSAGTQTWLDTARSQNHLGVYRASAGASTTVTDTLGSSVTWGLVGVDVIAGSTNDALLYIRRTVIVDETPIFLP